METQALPDTQRGAESRPPEHTHEDTLLARQGEDGRGGRRFSHSRPSKHALSTQNEDGEQPRATAPRVDTLSCGAHSRTALLWKARREDWLPWSLPRFANSTLSGFLRHEVVTRSLASPTGNPGPRQGRHPATVSQAMETGLPTSGSGFIRNHRPHNK